MRIKLMSLDEYKDVIKREWMPVELIENVRPRWMHNIPSNSIHSVYASGSGIGMPRPNIYSLPSGELIGGIDVYRNASDDPVKLNKDWYAIIADATHNDMLLVCGPFKDNEHWINEIPKRLEGAEVLAVPPKQNS